MSEPKSWCTVVPLKNLDDGLKTPVYFAKGLWLTLVPDWIRQDVCAESLSSPDRETLKQLRYAFIVEYAAACSGAPDPDWDGPEPRSIQDAKHELAMLANLALWIIRPSPVCFDLVFHAPRWEDGWNVQRSEKCGPIVCNQLDRVARLTDRDLDRAIEIHAALCKLPSGNSLWTALQSTWSALQIGNISVRELVMWIALEALFGAEGGKEDGVRMVRRIGYFLGTDKREAKELSLQAEKGYSLRCRIAHGERIAQPDLAGSAHETETFVRRSLAKLLLDDEMIHRFCGTGRESFLSGLVPD